MYLKNYTHPGFCILAKCNYIQRWMKKNTQTFPTYNFWGKQHKTQI